MKKTAKNVTAVAIRKVDMFQADREMSTRVTEFMTCKVWGIVLKTRVNEQVKHLRKLIDGWEKLNGSILGADASTLIDKANLQIERLQSALAEVLKKEARFEYTKADRLLYESYVNSFHGNRTWDPDFLVPAFQTWFLGYGLKVGRDTTLMQSLLKAMEGERSASVKIVVGSGATQFTTQQKTRAEFLKVFYGILAESMLQAGTLKPCDIPEDVRDVFAKKAEKSKAKKSEKKRADLVVTAVEIVDEAARDN